jgi:hypothetical protein
MSVVDVTLRPRSSIMASSYQEPSYGKLLTTTKYRWDTFVPYSIPRQQEQQVPEQYLKNAWWGYSPHTGTEAYHATSSAEDDGTLYPVEFIYDHLCWCYDNVHIFHFLTFIYHVYYYSRSHDRCVFISHMTHYKSFLGLYFPHDSPYDSS